MAQTAVDLMDEYLGMKDGPERDFKQSLKDRRDESIGATESSLVDRLFKSVQEAFSPGSESGRTMSDRDRAIIGELTGVRVPPIEVDRETSEVITESPEGAAALDETMQLPSAMDLAQMGMGLGSRQTQPPPLQEGLGAFGFQPHQLPVPERLSPYEEMLMLLSLGIPGAALGGRAVGGLMRGMKGRGIPARNEEALEKILNAPSAMRDMGPQLGRPIPGRSGAATQRILGSSQRDFANKQHANKGLESLKRFMGRENLRRPQVSKMAGAKFVDPDHKKVFTRAFGGPKDNTMYMWSDDAADYFKDTMSRKTFRIPRESPLQQDLRIKNLRNWPPKDVEF